MQCVSKHTCTCVIVISLWLTCNTQCGFSIYYLSIPRIEALDRCNTSPPTFYFFISTLMCAVAFIYLTNFWEDAKLGKVVGGMRGMRV